MKASKILARLAVLTLALGLMFGTMAVGVFADYDYTMTVSGGNGKVDGKEILKCESAEASTVDPDKNEIIINGDTANPVTVTPPSDKYFVIGLKETGYDNTKLLTSEVKLADRKEDVSLVVAYGLKSDMVKYTVRYINRAGGADLLPQETHYGVANSKPVVSYKYVEGYLPYAYNLTGTITRGGANEFYFYYDQVDAEGNIVTIVDGGGAAGAGGGAAGGAGGAGGANINDGDVPAGQPADIIDIDDDGTPTTDPDGTDIDDNDTPGVNWAIIGGGAALVAAIAAAAIAIARRRRDEEEEVEE